MESGLCKAITIDNVAQSICASDDGRYILQMDSTSIVAEQVH
jgi:hypothetical protein